MNYIEAVDYIHSLLKFGIRPGLSGMDALLRFLDYPEKYLKYVHIAGTNGKGSTSTAISNILIDSGYDVGLYTSPYVTEFLERVQFNGRPVDKLLFSECVSKVRIAVKKCEKHGITITEFEALTAAAFLCFKELKCDIVCLEVGLGGRLDATNIIGSPLVNVITSLSLDHTGVLGDTIEDIAFEKCGTIKNGGRVVSSFGQPTGALKIIEETVNNKNCELIIPDEKEVNIINSDLFGTEFLYKNILYKTKLPGEHQVKNMTCVIEACNILKENFLINDCNVKEGIFKTVLPARVEVLSAEPLVVLDGGHNEDGAKAFYNAVESILSKDRKVIVLAGMMADKAVESSLKPLFLRADEVVCVTPDNPRAMDCKELKKIASCYCENTYAISSSVEAVKKVFDVLTRDDILLSVGSLYLAGEIRTELIECLKKFS